MVCAESKASNLTSCFIPRPTVTDPRPTEASRTLLGHLRLCEEDGLSIEICFDLYNLSLTALARDCVLIVWNLCHITEETLLMTLTEFMVYHSLEFLAVNPTQTVSSGVLREIK